MNVYIYIYIYQWELLPVCDFQDNMKLAHQCLTGIFYTVFLCTRNASIDHDNRKE